MLNLKDVQVDPHGKELSGGHLSAQHDLEIDTDDERLKAAFMRAQQMFLVSRVGIIAVINGLNAMFVVASMWLISGSLGWPDYAWGLFAIANSVLMWRLYKRYAHREAPKKVSGRLLKAGAVQSFLLGLAWALPTFRASGAGDVAIFFFASIQIAMAAGTTAILSSVRVATMSYVVPTCLGAGAATIVLGEAGYVFLFLSLVLIFALDVGCRNSQSQLRQEISARFAERDSHANLVSAIEAMKDGFALVSAGNEKLLTNKAFRDNFDEDFSLDGALTKRSLIANGKVFEPSSSQGDNGTKVYLFSDITERADREADLERALTEAEAADRSKVRFLESMSHELRTPLNVIIGFARLMSTGSNIKLSPQEMSAYADRISDSGQHLLRMLDDILAYSQLGLEYSTNSQKQFELPGVIRKAARLAATFEEVGSDLDLSIKVSRALNAVIADPLAVERILIALISNAIKFGSDRPRVAIAAGLTSEGAPYISVRDWGAGIDERDFEKIFEPFYQGDPHFRAGAKGAGLGLTISRRLARANGGELVINSRSQAGTVATLVLRPENHVAKPAPRLADEAPAEPEALPASA